MIDSPEESENALSAQLALQHRCIAELEQEVAACHMLINSVPDCIFFKDREHRFLRLNQAAITWLGASRAEDVIGKTEHDFLPAAQAESTHAIEDQVFKTGEAIIDRVYPVTRHDGQLRWTSTTLAPMRDASGQITGLIGISRDITERKNVETAIEENRDQLALAVSGCNGGLWDIRLKAPGVDPKDLPLVHYSPRLKSIIGYADHEFPNSVKAWFSLIHNDDRDKVTASANDHLEGRTPVFDVEYRIRHRDGSLRWVHGCGRVYRDANGDPERWAGMDWDITDQREAEEGLHRREAILEALVFAAERFLTPASWEENIHQVLEALGKATKVESVYVFENHAAPDGELLTSQRFIWHENPNINPIDVSLLQNLPYKASGFGRWMETLHRGDIISGNMDHFPENELHYFAFRNVKSIVLVPVFSGGSWWGFIGLDGAHGNRSWPRSILDALKTAAVMLGAAIQRRNVEEARQRSERFLQMVQNATLDAMEVIAADGTVIWHNTVAQSLFGNEIGKPCFLQGHNRTERCEDCLHPHILQDGQPRDTEFPMEDRQGNLHVLWVRATPLRDEAGNIVSVLETSRDITARKQAEERLQASLKEKEVLLKEIHHRVKNNLQVISSLLDLQASQIKESKAIDAFRDSQNRVRVMALVHEKLYKTENLACVDLSEYLQSVAVTLLDAYEGPSNPVCLNTRIDPIPLDLDRATPCGLIASELLSNALKHAFPIEQPTPRVSKKTDRRNEIWMTFSREDNQYILSISDNGAGLPPDFDLRKSKSLGMQLVATLARQLHGSITVDHENGSTFTLTFPVK